MGLLGRMVGIGAIGAQSGIIFPEQRSGFGSNKFIESHSKIGCLNLVRAGVELVYRV